MDEKKFVVPGDFIGTEEEYLPGAGTRSEGEKVFATLTGEVTDKARTLSIEQKRKLAPLGIGTLQLEDGTSVQGFLCEPLALEGATNISHFGGWRAYIASLQT